MRFAHEAAWLSLGQMADLFQRDKSVISRHIKNIFEEGELRREAVVANFATTGLDGKTYQVDHFGLEVILAVGYRVKSHRGTQFRMWATQRLREYIVKGFTLDDERLKQAGESSYFDELLARIRDIRSSEKVFWRKVLEIYATSVDYDPKAEASQPSPPPSRPTSRRPSATSSSSKRPAPPPAARRPERARRQDKGPGSPGIDGTAQRGGNGLVEVAWDAARRRYLTAG